MELKEYQREALVALRRFLERTRETNDAAASFEEVAQELSLGRYQGQYRPLATMPEVPYVCLRLPTGGGKTILGAHSVKLAGGSFLERDFPVALWLVPSNTIRTQTVEALKGFGLDVVAAGHCTGWRAMAALTNAFGDTKLTPLAVGKRLSF